MTLQNSRQQSKCSSLNSECTIPWRRRTQELIIPRPAGPNLCVPTGATGESRVECIWQVPGGSTRISTATDARREAENKHAECLEQEIRPSGPAGLEGLTIPKRLTVHTEERAAKVANPATIGDAIDAVDALRKAQTISAIAGSTCRKYANSGRRTGSTASSCSSWPKSTTSSCRFPETSNLRSAWAPCSVPSREPLVPTETLLVRFHAVSAPKRDGSRIRLVQNSH
ncbi:hypothetical protein DEA8626_04017 [Defluviimonas aquaemixtae]|uniref:Uncharacterized protein n=1 Tax=Albidovulum aquaemixtae TaxID=1542388 RepID=A0A2R8BNS1_9RHOB|nr:hypothetical protein DEA8626_04017 [Defluviimonas aquaemixtae]